MADEKFNLGIEPARLTTAAPRQRHQLQKDTRSRIVKGLKWVALAVFVLFMLNSALMAYQNGVEVVRGLWVDRAKERHHIEAKQSVTEEEAREMLVKDKMRTVIGEFCAPTSEKLISDIRRWA